MKDKNSKMSYKIDKVLLPKSKPTAEKYNPLSEIRSKKNLEPVMEDNILLVIQGSKNDSIKNQKREQINKILARFHNTNSISVSSRKSLDLKSNEFLSRSKSKVSEFKNSAINFKSVSNKIINDCKNFKTHTQTKHNNVRDTVNTFDENLKSSCSLTRRRNEGKYGIVYPAYSATGRSKREHHSITRNNEIQRLNINLETDNFNEEKESKVINLRMKDPKHRFSSSNTSEDLNSSISNKNFLMFNIHKNNSTEVLDIKKLEETSFCNEYKSSLKANDKLLSGNKCRSSSQMNCSAIKNDKLNSITKKVVIAPSATSNIKFIFRSPSNSIKRKSMRPYSHIPDKNIVHELSESNTYDKSTHKNESKFLKKRSSSKKETDKKDIIKKINQLDENKIGKLAKLLEKLDYIDLVSSKNKKNLKNSEFNKSDNIHSINKFNINYIQTDHFNFGNININLNTVNNINNKLINKQNYNDEKLRSSIYSKSESKNIKKVVKFNDIQEKISNKIRSSSNSRCPLSNCSVIRIIILSNWGHQFKVGITEIQLFDVKFQKINILECHVLNGNDENISKLHNNRIYSIDDNDMWIGNYSKNMKIEIHYRSIYELESMMFWNYNGRDLTKGVKEMEIQKLNNTIWKGIVNKGFYNLRANFSTHISLYSYNIFKSKNSSEFLKKEYKNISNSDYVSIDYKNQEIKDEIEEANELLNKSIQLDDLKNDCDHEINLKKNNINVNKSVASFEETHSKSKNYKSIKIILKSNWGDFNYVGLSKIQFMDENNLILNKSAIESYNINTNKCSSLDTLFDNIIDNKWWSTINTTHNYYENCEFEPIIIEVIFKSMITLNGMIIWNFNSKGELIKGAKLIDIMFDNKKASNNCQVVLSKGIGHKNVDYSQTIRFPLINYTYKEEELLPFKEFKPANLTFYQDYDPPYLPSGYIFKFSLISTWGDEMFIGIKKIEFYDQNGNSIINYLTPRVFAFPYIEENSSLQNLVSSKEGFIAPFVSTRILDNEEKECNTLYYIFERPVCLSYIIIWNYSKNSGIGVREFILSCDENLIYKGFIKKSEDEESSCCILFTSDTIITNEVHKKIYIESSKVKEFKITENTTVNKYVM